MRDGPGLLLLGYGYVAARLAPLAAQAGWRVAATARDEASLAAIRRAGFVAWPFDAPRALSEEAFDGITHVLSSVPPSAEGDAVLRALGDGLRMRAGRLAWVGYLSTVGVYGDHGGAWVNEESACRPVSERGRRRLRAEEQWRQLAREASLPLHIFRLPGIYGPGRNALRKMLSGQRKALVVKEGQVFSRIHVDDLARALWLSMGKPHPAPGRIYNVSDDEPAPAHEVALYACRLLGLPPPPLKPLAEAGLSDMARSFYGESKRVSSARIRRELGWRPRFPTYREGLTALLETERGN